MHDHSTEYKRTIYTYPEGSLCSVDGCTNRPCARGLCRKHAARFYRHGDPLVETRIFHFQSRRNAWSAEYGIWAGMIQRCTNPKAPKFRDYGGRGVTVNERCEFQP